MRYKTRAAFFVSPGKIEVRTTVLDAPDDTPIARSRVIGISHGTELKFFTGDFIAGPSEDGLPDVPAQLEYPLNYGYMNVGETSDGARFFGFAPHHDRFPVRPGYSVALPASIEDEDAVLLPSVETALALAHDVTPAFGESVLVFGLGTIGLLCAEILATHTGCSIVTADPVAFRRALADRIGCTALDPTQPGFREEVRNLLGAPGVDWVVNTSGSETALEHAFDLLRHEGTIIEGSWYGSRRVSLPLGGGFHRKRLTIRACQVSTIRAAFSAGWDRSRGTAEVMKLIDRIRPSKYITHRFPLEQAQAAFETIRTAADVLQVVLVPDHTPELKRKGEGV